VESVPEKRVKKSGKNFTYYSIELQKAGLWNSYKLSVILDKNKF
jgi:hypothetical protein